MVPQITKSRRVDEWSAESSMGQRNTRVSDLLIRSRRKVAADCAFSCGKTFLCSALIDRFRTTFPTKRLLFFFFDGTSQTKNSSTSILRSLIAQMIAGNSSLVRVAFPWVIKSGQERATSFKGLLDMFRDLLDFENSPVHLIVDALDECNDCRQTSLLDEIHQILSEQWRKQCKVVAIIFSRVEPWIEHDIQSCAAFEVTSQAIEQDIKLYVERSLRRPPLSMIRDTSLELRIIESLTTKANGQFLWVRLMIQALKKSTFISDIEHALQNLPRGLGQAYKRILENLLVEGESRRAAGHMVLQWLACAERPLTVAELGTALSIRKGALDIDARDRPVDLSSFLEELCGALIKISDPGNSQKGATVSFVHLTVKEYLISSEELWGQNAGPIAQFRVESSLANRHIAAICVTQLTSAKIRNTGKAADSPFYEYAAFYWATHLAHSGPPAPELLRLLSIFVSSAEFSAYLESLLDGNKRPSILLETQGHLNKWIRGCDPGDPRLRVIFDCFRSCFEKTYRHRLRILGPHHGDTLEACYQFAKVLHVRGEWIESEILHRQVAEFRLQTIGWGDARCLESMYQWGRVLTRLGRHAESRPLQEQTLAKRRDLLGADAPDTLLSEDALAGTLKEQGELDEAEALSRATLLKKVREFGEDSLEYAETADNLASIVKDIGLARNRSRNVIMAKEAFWECERLSRQCLSVRERYLGPNNSQTNTSLNMLGIVLRHLRRPEESERCHRQVLAVRRTMYGEHSPHTQRSTRNLIATLRDQAKTQEAAELESRLRESQKIDTTLAEREKRTDCHVPAPL